MNNILTKVNQKIESGEEISPFLFVGKNLEIINRKVEDLAKSLLKEYNIPNAYLYILRDGEENLKVKDVKDFVEFSNSKPPFRFQIFFIENISRLTLASANSLLKFFEEPGKENIIFLTNASENNVLDTILSRVVVFNLSSFVGGGMSEGQGGALPSIENWDEVISYFFKNKLEKEEYLAFLENLVKYARQNFCFIEFLNELENDINGIKQNNLNARFIVDKWLIKLSV